MLVGRRRGHHHYPYRLAEQMRLHIPSLAINSVGYSYPSGIVFPSTPDSGIPLDEARHPVSACIMAVNRLLKKIHVVPACSTVLTGSRYELSVSTRPMSASPFYQNDGLFEKDIEKLPETRRVLAYHYFVSVCNLARHSGIATFTAGDVGGPGRHRTPFVLDSGGSWLPIYQ